MRPALPVTAALLGGSAVLLACSGGDGRPAPAKTTAVGSSSSPLSPDPGASSTVALNAGSEVTTPSAVTTRGRGAGATTGPDSVSPPLVDALPSGEVRIRDAEVGSVDRPARTFTLRERPQGYQVVVITGATAFRLAEGDAASFADVEPGGVVAITGTPATPDRLVAKQVIVLA